MLDSYSPLGRSGLRVSRLALGTMTFGQKDWGCDAHTAAQILDVYLDAGGNFVDTADMYAGGASEEMVGALIAERKVRDKVVLSTKFTMAVEPGDPNSAGNGRKSMLRALEGSLRRLRTDFVDLYILHAWDTLTPLEEVTRAPSFRRVSDGHSLKGLGGGRGDGQWWSLVEGLHDTAALGPPGVADRHQEDAPQSAS